MPMIDNSYYIGVGATLYTENNDKNHKYFYSQSFNKLDTASPFEGIIPTVDDFWGPKILNLLLVTQDYSWNEFYVSAQLETFKTRWVNFELYQAKIWVDLSLAADVDAENGNTAYTDAMNVLADYIEATCAEMADYGWEYMGTLSEHKDSTYFQPYITAFYEA